MRTKETHKIWILIILITSSLNTQAQDWSIFPPNTSSIYFENDNSLLFALKVDSTFTSPLSNQTYLAPTLEISTSGNSFPCEGTPGGGVITGSQIFQNDSVIQFRFYDGILNIPLKVTAASSTIALWPFTVTRISKRDSIINGTSDSIMEFKVTSIGNRFDSCLVKSSIIIAKQSGLLTSISCFAFFTSGTLWFETPGHIFRSTPKLDASKIWDFKVGDEFHFIEDDYYMRQGQSNLLNYKVLSKSTLGNDFIYTMGFVKQRTSKPDTVGTETWIRPQQFIIPDSIPNRAAGNDYNIWGQNWKGTGRPFYRTVKRQLLVYNDSCFGFDLPEFDVTIQEHVQGLGEVQNQTVNDKNGVGILSGPKLIYYKKGTETYGTPKYIGAKEIAFEKIALYPNPANHTIELMGLEANSPITWVISTLSGKEISNGVLSLDNPTINVKNFAKGVYILKTENHQFLRFLKN